MKHGARRKRGTSQRVAGDSAAKTALIPQPHGGALYAGGVPGNRGGGRHPDEFRSRMAECASRDETIEALEEILRDRDHPHFMRALEFCADRGYGKIALELNSALASIDVTRLSDDQLQRIVDGEHPLAVIGTPSLEDGPRALPPGHVVVGTR